MIKPRRFLLKLPRFNPFLGIDIILSSHKTLILRIILWRTTLELVLGFFFLGFEFHLEDVIAKDGDTTLAYFAIVIDLSPEMDPSCPERILILYCCKPLPQNN